MCNKTGDAYVTPPIRIHVYLLEAAILLAYYGKCRVRLAILSLSHAPG